MFADLYFCIIGFLLTGICGVIRLAGGLRAVLREFAAYWVPKWRYQQEIRCSSRLITAGDRVTGPAQVVRQILLHLYRCPKRHRVQVRVQFRQQANAIALDRSGLLSFLTSQPKFCPAMKTRTLSILGTVALLVSGFCSNAFGAETPATTSRPAIYDEKADGAKQIADALAVAKKENRRVLLQFGANWCGWCHKLHKLCQTDPDIAAKLKESFVVVLVDVNKGHNGDITKAQLPDYFEVDYVRVYEMSQ